MEKAYIEDALSAITSAYSQDEIIGVYLAGHSLGAVVAPSIVQLSQNVDGPILLSPVIRRHAELVIDLNRYYTETNQLDNKAIEGLTDFLKKIFAFSMVLL